MHGYSTVEASIRRSAHSCGATHDSKWVPIAFLTIEDGAVGVVNIWVPRAGLHSGRGPSLATYCDRW